MARKPIALTMICGVVALASAAPASATFPGRNGRIAYATDDGISTVRPDGTDVRPLVAFPGALDPAWSADGRRLAFAAPGDGGHLVIYVVRSDGSHLRQVSRPGVDRWHPSWAPGGNRLAVLGDAPPVDGQNRGAVIVLKVANGHERRVADAGAGRNFGDAEWSPDGGAIAFTDTDIFLVSPEGGTPVQITHEPGDFEEERPDGTIVHHFGHSVQELSWAPRGRRLAFSDLVNCPCDDAISLAVIKRDGSGRRDIPSDQTERAPAWAPDGSAIDFCGYNPYITEPSLWTMRPDGTGQHEVLTGAGCRGDWQAIPPKRRQ